MPSAAPAPTFVCRSAHSISALRSREQSSSASGSLPTTLTTTGSFMPCGLPERERVRLGAWLEEGDLERPLADRVVLAYELVHAAILKEAVFVLVDVNAV